LHFAAQYGHLELIKFLVAQGAADINAIARNNKTPLHLAVEQRHVGIVQFLLDQGANLEVQDMLRQTPLYYAAASNHLEVVRVLLNNGADADKINISVAVNQ